eukprot:6594195-Prymnesium_polylepis.1
MAHRPHETWPTCLVATANLRTGNRGARGWGRGPPSYNTYAHTQVTVTHRTDSTRASVPWQTTSSTPCHLRARRLTEMHLLSIECTSLRFGDARGGSNTQ